MTKEEIESALEWYDDINGCLLYSCAPGGSNECAESDAFKTIFQAAENWLLLLRAWNAGHASLVMERLVKGPECSVQLFPNVEITANSPEEALRLAVEKLGLV